MIGKKNKRLAGFDFVDGATVFIQDFATAIGAANFGFCVFVFDTFSAIKTDIIHGAPLC